MFFLNQANLLFFKKKKKKIPSKLSLFTEIPCKGQGLAQPHGRGSPPQTLLGHTAAELPRDVREPLPRTSKAPRMVKCLNIPWQETPGRDVKYPWCYFHQKRAGTTFLVRRNTCTSRGFFPTKDPFPKKIIVRKHSKASESIFFLALYIS